MIIYIIIYFLTYYTIPFSFSLPQKGDDMTGFLKLSSVICKEKTCHFCCFVIDLSKINTIFAE